MATECQLPFTDDDEKMLQEAEERGTVIPECFTEPDPEVEEALDQRFDQMMEERSREFIERIEDITPEEKKIFGELQKQATEETEEVLSNLKPVDPSPEERGMKRKVGQELNLSGAQWFGSPDVTRFPDREAVKEVMAVLNNPRVPRAFTRFDVVPQIQYVDKQLWKTEGLIKGLTDKFRDKDGMERVSGVYVAADKNGECPKGQAMLRVIGNEIVHCNSERFRQQVKENEQEFGRALSLQIQKEGMPSRHSYSRDREELQAELYSCYLADQEKLSKEMIEFFGKHFSPEAWGEY